MSVAPRKLLVGLSQNSSAFVMALLSTDRLGGSVWQTFAFIASEACSSMGDILRPLVFQAFNEEHEFFSFYREFRDRAREKCCGRACLRALNEREFRAHCNFLEELKAMPVETRNPLFYAIVSATLLAHLEKGHYKNHLCLPSFSEPLCIQAFATLLFTNARSIQELKNILKHSRCVLLQE